MRQQLTYTPKFCPWSAFLLIYAICWGIMFIPFAVVDLFLAFKDNSCLDQMIGGYNITLSTWLQIDGYVISGFLGIFLLLGSLAACLPESKCVYVLWQIGHIPFMCWRLAWLVFGGVMFWRSYVDSGLCSNRVIKYMWVNLITGYVWLFVELFLTFAFIKPTLVGVSTPPMMVIPGQQSSTTIFSPAELKYRY